MEAVDVFILVFLVLAFLAALLLNGALKSLPSVELRRRSRGEPKDKSAKYIYELQQIGWPADLFIWAIGTAAATILVIWASQESYWWSAAVAALLALLLTVHRKLNLTSSVVWWLAGAVTRSLVWLLHWLDPLWQRLPKTRPGLQPDQIYELDDLINLIDKQASKPGNRIVRDDLNSAKASLGFNSRTVKELTVPFKDVRLVLPDESIGPHLMDELYAAGHSAFPVGKKTARKLPPQLEGVVYLGDLVTSSLHGDISRVMIRELNYIEQNETLPRSLEIFLKNHTSLLIVMGEREETLGVLWLEDVLAQLLGRPLNIETEHPADADAREKVVE